MRSAVKCDACGQARQASMPTATTIDGGWYLPYEHFGFYAGFTDNLEALMADDEPRSWSICHDCVVKFLDTFPLLAKSIESGGHHSPYEAKPCCNYAWSSTLEGETVFASGGEWIVAPKQ